MPRENILEIKDIKAKSAGGNKSIHIQNIHVNTGEIVGVAGISGNGQAELMEILTGQRRVSSGTIQVAGKRYQASRAQAQAHKVRYLPEEPLNNACAPGMSVADNLALRMFDEGRRSLWLDRRAITKNAIRKISEFRIKTRSKDEPLRALSGGNIQRTALARELSGEVKLLIVANPCFGLDFSAVQAIRSRLFEARNKDVGILLISEDLDELMELSDRILVMSEGTITYQTNSVDADIRTIGHHMSGQLH
jgi:simple sugar transport system ATP-binding protein